MPWQHWADRLRLWRFVRPVALPTDRGEAPIADESGLQEHYRAVGLDRPPDSFVLYRIIGNDLVPRHAPGQSLQNLRFILEHEPKLESCEKRFVVNRIVDPKQERQVIELLKAHDCPYLHLPFDPDSFAAQPLDVDGVPGELLPPFPSHGKLWADQAAQIRMRLYRHKNNDLMNNNGARNAALADGRARAKWVLPWDGNCFLTQHGWNELRTTVAAEPHWPYFIVPMARVTDNRQLLSPGFSPQSEAEPQIVFRKDAGESFDECFYYGRRPKVELLWRLGVPGRWDEWGIQPWDLPCPSYSNDAGAWKHAGWVARLNSGRPDMEKDRQRASNRRRLDARVDAVCGFIDQVDADGLARWYEDNPCPLITSDAEVGTDPVNARRYDPSLLEKVSVLCQQSSDPGALLELAFLCDELESVRRNSAVQACPILEAELSQCQDWLLRSRQGRRMREHADETGLVRDLLVLRLGLYLQRYGDAVQALHDMSCRWKRMTDKNLGNPVFRLDEVLERIDQAGIERSGLR